MKFLAEGKWVTRDRVTAVACISAIGAAAMLLFLWLTSQDGVDMFGHPVGTDFAAFHTAGLMANEGQVAEAWKPDLLNRRVDLEHPSAQFHTAWLYPPVFLLVAAPLAALPYLAAVLVWQLVSLAVMALTLHAITRERRATLVALACPLTPMMLAHGQNGFVTAALLGSGLLLLDRRPAASGTLLGCLVYKPQLALLIGPLLVVTRSWRTLIHAAIAAMALLAASVALWGTESWTAFVGSLAYGRTFMEEGAVGFYKSASLFSATRQWGAPASIAHVVQAVGTIASLGMVWRLRASSAAIRNAGICAATALSTPYLLDYDLALVGLGAVFFYAHAARTGFRQYERSALAVIWFAPWFTRMAAEHLLLPLGPAIMILLAWLVMRRAGSEHRHSAVDVQSLAGDVTGFPARQVDGRRSDVFA